MSSGLTLAVAAGQAMIDGPVTLPTAGSVVLADNAWNWIWLLQSGTITKTSLGAETPVPDAPSTACVFLGRVRTISGSVTAIDGSGVLRLLGGTLYRKTGDYGAPTDTPPASLQFLQRTGGGSYWWDGSQYTPLAAASGAVVSAATQDLLDILLSLQPDVEDLGRKLRALLLYVSTTLGEIPPGLEDDLDLALSEA